MVFWHVDAPISRKITDALEKKKESTIYTTEKRMRE